MVDDEQPRDEGESCVSTIGTSERVHYDWCEPTCPSVAVVDVVAAVTNRDPATLPQLTEQIDPDALNALLIGTGREQCIQVSFAYAGVSLIVDSTGQVEVVPEAR